MTHAYEAVWASGATLRFRLLTWKEFRHAASLVEDRDLWIYRTSVLEGPSLDLVTAGVVTWLGYFQINNSPFSETAEIVQKFRALTQQQFESSYLLQARALVAGTFRYQFEEIDNWDHETFFERLVAAELLIGKRMEPVPANQPAADPEEVRKAQKAAVRKQLADQVNRRRRA